MAEVGLTIGLRPEARGKAGGHPPKLSSPGLNPWQMAYRRLAEFGDASAVSPGKGGLAREPEYLYAVHHWTQQGTEDFLGHARCQGPTSGAAARCHEALILMGGWCGPRSRRHAHENTDASKMVYRRWSMPSGTQRKKCQKLCEGEVLPLDGSLLMGGFSEA